MTLSKDQIRLMIYRQIKLQHPEYTEQRLQLAVQETYDLVMQVQDAIEQDKYEINDYPVW